MVTSLSGSDGTDHPLVIGIGGSAGGIESLQHFLEAVPEVSGAAFVVVMHLAPDETSQLAEVLQPHTSMPVRQVSERTEIETDHVYVTAPGHTLLVEERTLVPEPLREPAERRSPIDTFFRTLARADVEPVGMVVSGSGTDGSVGLRAIVEVGGVIAAQDPSEAAYESMPRSAIETLFNIRASDTGRPIGDFTHQLEYSDLEADARSVLDDLTPAEREVPSKEDEWFLVRHHPYRTVDERIDGVVITFVDITRRKTAEQALREANRSLKDRSEQVQALSDALTSAEQTERRRISQILHDDLQQTLFAARMRIDHLREEVALDEDKDELAVRAIELLDDGVEKTRTLSSELDPPVGDQSLRDSLEWLAVQMNESYDLTVEVDSESAVRTADKNLRFLLFRLVRELLFNVVKHAEVGTARVALEEEEGFLKLVVEDEGVGFDPSEIDGEDEGFGLINVRERIRMIGGRLALESAPGEGTRITIEVPWQTGEKATAYPPGPAWLMREHRVDAPVTGAPSFLLKNQC